MKIKIHSDQQYLPEGVDHVVMLYPFWGKNPEHPHAPERGRFDRYEELGGRFFEMSSLADADFAVMPAPWEKVVQNETGRNLVLQFAAKANQAGKKTVVYFCSDSEGAVEVKNSVVLRTSFTRSKRKPNEFALPAWSEDILDRYVGGLLPERKKREKPVVGFCGYARAESARLKMKNFLLLARSKNRKKPPPLPGPVIRARALSILSASPGVENNFIVRENFLGGAWQADGQIDFDRMHKVRREFVQNIIESDYILCVRGGGNFSYRLYETLCCGRIPVFVDTDCVLPYDFAIDWCKYCVWIDQNELPKIADRVAEFHRNLSPHELLDLQYNCRRLWEEWLSPQGFFGKFCLHFETVKDGVFLGPRTRPGIS